MRKRSATLTPAELEIMRIVWGRSEATVRDVYETLRERRKVAQTTVLTVMAVLEAKGYLKRRAGQRPAVYLPTQLETAVERSMVREFIDRVFKGATGPLLVHLIEDRRVSPAELEDLTRRVKASREKKR